MPKTARKIDCLKLMNKLQVLLPIAIVTQAHWIVDKYSLNIHVPSFASR